MRRRIFFYEFLKRPNHLFSISSIKNVSIWTSPTYIIKLSNTAKDWTKWKRKKEKSSKRCQYYQPFQIVPDEMENERKQKKKNVKMVFNDSHNRLWIFRLWWRKKNRIPPPPPQPPFSVRKVTDKMMGR